ncbi:transcriptional regulator with XRE-family HTH domain [Hoeflea marina]|uniref:Transcriptional regulator with XRE-family HTH domain n=1 Tax=Hoeflea marina TaxID=274592 RepID=A0A317PHG7_9HYPH|nr:helix-turn-helix transcriptional regulator [Hoeflea marina]PWV98341.1 transcriptional regulator with XRE-family HTH domain [Hoeflea marina]
MNKDLRARLFRDRMVQRMKAAGTSRSGLARACGVDRSTISQILNGEDLRLPNAHLAAEFASVLGVSADWLLGLSEHSATAADVLAASLRIADASRTSSDEQLREWQQEAAGHKIRYVPATLPDFLKTEAVLEFEYAAFLDKTPTQATIAARDTAQFLGRPGSDYEICVPIEMVRSLARGEGYWTGLPEDARHHQIRTMAESCARLYPSLRLYLYDSRKLYSAPVTVFGRFLAVVYVGQIFLVYRDVRQVSALTGHFDALVRDSEVDARSAASVIRGFLPGRG